MISLPLLISANKASALGPPLRLAEPADLLSSANNWLKSGIGGGGGGGGPPGPAGAFDTPFVVAAVPETDMRDKSNLSPFFELFQTTPVV